MKKISKIFMCSLLLLLAVTFLPFVQVNTKAAANGFVTKSGKTYYYKNGVKHTGWLKLNGKTYYFASNGVQKKGWAYYNGKKYRYFSSGSGAMVTGFMKTSQGIYHFKSNGVLSYGWIKIGSDRYYGNTKTGVLLTGWILAPNGQKRYFYSSNGKMAKGWVKSGEKIRYFDSTGYMAAGFKTLNNKLYLFNTKNGYMYTNVSKVYNGKTYYFGADGVGSLSVTVDSDGTAPINTKGMTSLGEFKLTYYCPCSSCNGNSSGISASGKPLKVKHTVAVDTSLIPLGSILLINDQIYYAEDTGVRGKVIDILVGSHAECYKLGVGQAEVYLLGVQK